MTGSVEERDRPPVGQGHFVGADVLCDTTGFAGDNIGAAHVVEQRRLAVVDVSHHGDDRRTRRELCLVDDFILGRARLFFVFRDEFNLEAKLIGHR